MQLLAQSRGARLEGSLMYDASRRVLHLLETVDTTRAPRYTADLLHMHYWKTYGRKMMDQTNLVISRRDDARTWRFLSSHYFNLTFLFRAH